MEKKQIRDACMLHARRVSSSSEFFTCVDKSQKSGMQETVFHFYEMVNFNPGLRL